MDPITTAIVAALTKDACKDGYFALKNALKKKFGDQSDLVDAVDKLEQNPNSKGRKVTLQEEVEISKVNDDPDIRKLVQDLLDQNKEQPGVQEAINQIQTNQVSGVNAGRDFVFETHQEGNKS